MKYHYISESELSFHRRTGTSEADLEMIELKRALSHMHDLQAVANDDDSPPLQQEQTGET